MKSSKVTNNMAVVFCLWSKYYYGYFACSPESGFNQALHREAHQ